MPWVVQTKGMFNFAATADEARLIGNQSPCVWITSGCISRTIASSFADKSAVGTLWTVILWLCNSTSSDVRTLSD